MKNHEFLFTAKSKIELLECEMPTPGPGEFVAQTILTQISTGTELTWLEGNVYEGSLWDVVFPRRPGYNNVAKIVAVGEGISPDLIGKRIITSNPKNQSTVDFDFCNRNNLTVIGAANPRYHRLGGTEANRWTSGNDIKFILELMRQGRFVTEDLITHEFSFKDAVAVYDRMMKDRTQALGVNFRWDEE